jgi:2-octaprenylphenol hydroxylase
MTKDYDILVVGGGMVGAGLACALGDSTLRVAVIESRQLPVVPEDGYDLRVSAITLASRAIFENVGAWAGMQRRRVSPLREMHIRDAQGSGAIHFDAAELGEPELGYIIENSVINSALLERMAGFDNVDLLCPAQIADLHMDATHVTATLKDGNVLRASLLVGADGARSAVRDWAGIATRGWDYDQTAIVATVRTARPHGDAAWQVFLPTGPLAFLPLRDDLSSIVWSCDTARADQLLQLDTTAFVSELGQAFGDALGNIESISRRAGYPLSLAHADHYARERLVLVGDAAHRVHPLAGQGVNLGLLDAATLAGVVLEAARSRRDIGALAVLRRYERWRKGNNIAMLAVTDAFKRGFGSGFAPLVQLRNAGLGFTDGIAPLKRMIMRQAVGLDGDLPELARSAPR